LACSAKTGRAKPREALRAIGLERFAPPLLVAGRIDLEGADLSAVSPLYVGLSPKEADRIRFREPPAYMLTIENFASFNRHIIEADPGHLGTTIYVGGYPSLATQEALRTLAGAASPATPIFHWSDIDPDGTWIARDQVLPVPASWRHPLPGRWPAGNPGIRRTARWGRFDGRHLAELFRDVRAHEMRADTASDGALDRME
jgi:hypothetical protein